MERIRVQARALQPGDQIGSGETVVRVSTGVHTPRGKVEIILTKVLVKTLRTSHRVAYWGAYTMIWVQR